MVEDDSPIRTDRFVDEQNDEWSRSPFERDRDRILYTRELRRLKDVTQVARARESYLYHDRLSHSLKVAQVGRRLAEIVVKRPRNGDIDFDTVLDPDVVESACLAHDLGHPLFGHLSEQALDQKIREKTTPSEENEDDEKRIDEWIRENGRDASDITVYGYEGNAQSFRIVTRLSPHHKTNAGLNLTHATLNAVLKYPHSREENDDKWGYYPTEEDRFDWTRRGLSDGKTLEAELMDYADDVTYAIHDVADFYKGGLIPLEHLLSEAQRREEARRRIREERKEKLAEEDGRAVDSIANGEFAIDEVELPGKPTLREFESHIKRSDTMSLRETTVEEFFLGLSRFPGVRDHLFTPFEGTDEENDTLSRLISNLVSRYLNGSDETDPEFVHLSFDSQDEQHCLYVDRSYREQVWLLKELTFYYVINNATLVGQQRGQRRVIEELFDALYEETWQENLNASAIPAPYRDWLRDGDVDWPTPIHRRARIVADMIATMTEPQAVTLHKRLTGDTPGSLQDAIIR